MEVLTFTVPEVEFVYPDPNTSGITATYSLNDSTPTNLVLTLDGVNKIATARLPYQTAEGQIKVTWSFTIPGSGAYTRTDYYDVVTPLLNATQVRNIIGSDATDAEVWASEASARYIIQAHTGQTFGKYVGKISVTGSGETFLRLPRRLISLSSINDNTILPNWVVLRGGGWFIDSKLLGVPSIRADFDGWHQDPNSGVITAPPRWARSFVGFSTNYEYVIDGTWGWDAVPSPVVEAAKLLVNDYACGDSIYRDRYLSSISGPDWRFAFKDGAYTSTGNVRADQLLADYRLRRGWMVI